MVASRSASHEQALDSPPGQKGEDRRSGQLSSIHVDAVLRLAQAARRRQVSPPSRRSGSPPRARFALVPPMPRVPAPLASPKPYSHRRSISTPARPACPSWNIRVPYDSRVIDWPPQGRETSVTGAVLDRDRLRVPLMVRNWRPGDSVQLLGHQKRHRLSRLLNELGVSRWEKVSWPVLTSGGTDCLGSRFARCRGICRWQLHSRRSRDRRGSVDRSYGEGRLHIPPHGSPIA